MPFALLILLRSILAYFSLFILVRLMGKREISQLTFFDYIVGIGIGTIAGTLAVDTSVPSYGVIIALVVFASFQILFSYLSLKSISFRKLTEGSSTPLIENGTINVKNLSKVRMNIDELQTKLREKNAFRLEDVEFAYLETDGKVSVMKKSSKETLTPNDIGLKIEKKSIGRMIIREGKIDEKVLRETGLTKAWLQDKLSAQGIGNIEEVMFAQVDDSGKLYIDV